MTHTSTEQERAEFEARFKHLDLTQEPDSWGAPRYKHDAISLAWEAWQTARRAQVVLVPQGWKLVQIELLERIQESLGSYLSDHGWSQSDMDAADALDGLLAAVPQPPACNQSMQPELATYSAQARNKKRNRAMNAEQAIDAEIQRQEQELTKLREELATIEKAESPADDQDLLLSVLSCPHTVTHESITLRFNPKQEGYNALAQLHNRLAAYDAAAKARELELLAVIEDLERLIPLINRGGTP